VCVKHARRNEADADNNTISNAVWITGTLGTAEDTEVTPVYQTVETLNGGINSTNATWANSYRRLFGNSAAIVSITNDSTTAWPTGTEITLHNACADGDVGTIAVQSAVGELVTLNYPANGNSTAFSGEELKLKKVGVSEWDVALISSPFKRELALFTGTTTATLDWGGTFRVKANNGDATVLIPDLTAVEWVGNTEITLLNSGTGSLTVSAVPLSVTNIVRANEAETSATNQGDIITLKRGVNNTWYVTVHRVATGTDNGYVESLYYRKANRTSYLDNVDFSSRAINTAFTVGSTASSSDITWDLLDDLPSTTAFIEVTVRMIIASTGLLGQEASFGAGNAGPGSTVIRYRTPGTTPAGAVTIYEMDVKLDVNTTTGIQFDFSVELALGSAFTTAEFWLVGYGYT
jgi:hypothetical protein